jgi:hypothetical protein
MTPLLTGLVGIGILIGLLFLGSQIRANTQAIRAETFQALVGQSTRLLESIYKNPDMAELLTEGQRGKRWENLTPIQQARTHNALLAVSRTFDNMVFQHRQGTIEEEFWKGVKETIHAYGSLPLWNEWFRENRRFYSEGLWRLLTAGKGDA